MSEYIPPNEGDVLVSVDEDNFVLVKVFKFDTIRQESYWAVDRKQCRLFKNNAAALQYAAQLNPVR